MNKNHTEEKSTLVYWKNIFPNTVSYIFISTINFFLYLSPIQKKQSIYVYKIPVSCRQLNMKAFRGLGRMGSPSSAPSTGTRNHKPLASCRLQFPHLHNVGWNLITSSIPFRSKFLRNHNISVPIKNRREETTLNKVAEYKLILRFERWLKAIKTSKSWNKLSNLYVIRFFKRSFYLILSFGFFALFGWRDSYHFKINPGMCASWFFWKLGLLQQRHQERRLFSKEFTTHIVLGVSIFVISFTQYFNCFFSVKDEGSRDLA